MRFYSCHYCDSAQVSELGAYVKINNKLWAHLDCYKKEIYQEGYKEGRLSVIKEQLDEQERKAREALALAETAYTSALRCQRCGLAMLADRPSVLPLSYSTVAPSSIQGVCSACVRWEIQTRAAARQVPVASTSAQAIQQAPSRPLETSQAKTEDKPKDRFSLLEID